MNPSDVAQFYTQIEARGVSLWLDGGWGVDALLGKQTRAHGDLDIVVEEKDVATVVAFLRKRGFRQLDRDDTCPWNFVMGDGRGREIDFHVIGLDANGNGRYGPPEHGNLYPAEALTGEGQVDALQVRCISPAFQIASHRGYDFNERDYRDVVALAERFGLEIPREYQDFGKRQRDS